RVIDVILFCNEGDWVESLTARVETNAGVLLVVTWQGGVAATAREPVPRPAGALAA
ncbi:MAG: UDP-2,3-diacylglucosamine diphosphatase, partial [Burkholderiales bacterium]|nr:UDP-2,3-diacylglucosamine diphosphatase [Burkholderiales bacterium]